MPTVRSPELTVVIPCRNEAATLPVVLKQLQTQQQIRLEIIIADGQSDDDTILVAQRASAKTCSASGGRGAQMNLGATLAESDLLLFLHADSEFSSDLQLRRALDRFHSQGTATLLAGHFPLQFIDRPAKQRRWSVLEYKTRLQKPLTINGDQGLLIRSQHFNQLGGFDQSLPFLEDQRLAAKIQQQGRWLLLPGCLKTSARRFQSQGFQQRYLLMTLIMVAEVCGLKRFLEPQALYPEQAKAKPISLATHIARFLALLAELPLKQRLGFYWRVAGLCRSNAYQLALWADAGLGLQQWPISRCCFLLASGLGRLPLLGGLMQSLLLPAFPLICRLWLLAASIGARMKSLTSKQV